MCVNGVKIMVDRWHLVVTVQPYMSVTRAGKGKCNIGIILIHIHLFCYLMAKQFTIIVKSHLQWVFGLHYMGWQIISLFICSNGYIIIIF